MHLVLSTWGFAAIEEDRDQEIKETLQQDLQANPGSHPFEEVLALCDHPTILDKSETQGLFRLTYPGLHDQNVFNKIKYDSFIRDNIGLQIRFLDTKFFGGFCEPSRDFDKVCTMHANCCVGLENKVHDLGIMLQDWKEYMQSFVNRTKKPDTVYWTVPQSCRDSITIRNAESKMYTQDEF
ncbi:hypothetical protein LXL04_006063 [Taraxacum kok-saghyz]